MKSFELHLTFYNCITELSSKFYISIYTSRVLRLCTIRLDMRCSDVPYCIFHLFQSCVLIVVRGMSRVVFVAGTKMQVSGKLRFSFIIYEILTKRRYNYFIFYKNEISIHDFGFISCYYEISDALGKNTNVCVHCGQSAYSYRHVSVHTVSEALFLIYYQYNYIYTHTKLVIWCTDFSDRTQGVPNKKKYVE